MRILAIIPAYNSENTIQQVIEGLKSNFQNRDILVVDDGSTDSTYEKASQMGIRIIKLDQNMGKGMALKSAFQIAIDSDYDAVITLDADMQHPPELCADFIKKAAETGADIIIGNRMHDIVNMPFARRLSNFLSSFFVRLWTRKRIPDSQCGYRYISGWIIEYSDLRVKNYQIETELILEASRLGATFDTIKIPTIYESAESNLNGFSETFRYIGLMITHPFRKREHLDEN